MPARHALRGLLAAILLLSFLAAPPAAARSLPAGQVDVITFGDAASESAHALKGEFTSAVDGALGERARVAHPTSPPGVKGGELRFRMAVDPVAQNYFTLKFWGGDASPYKTIAYVNGEQIGYRRSGDYEAINIGSSRPLPGRFHYNTIMLPLEHTRGQQVVEMTVRTYDGGFAQPVTADSRGYYRAYTHTTAHLDVSGEKQGSVTPDTTPAAGPSEAERQAVIDRYRQSQIALFNQYSAQLDASAGAKLSIVRYQDDLRFYASALLEPWSPANTPALRKAALERIFKVVDNHVKDYYANTRLLLRGGHQGDWGGYYGALGEALYIVENLIPEVYGAQAFQEFLDRPFATGTQDGPTSLKGADWDGGELSRREAWERVLKANFDFARSRLSYIYNQVMYTYEGAWEAHEGLRVIGSRFYEGKARSHRILLEALGVEPFLGEEVLVGPDGRDLDLYHSLFYHDQTARFTDDYVQIVGKGLARSKLDAAGRPVRRLPYGEHYTGITKAGLTRENTFVANYGEATNYLPEWFFRTWGHEGDERLNDEILKLALKNLHARGYTRYTDTDDAGKRVARAEMVVDERNTAYPGWPAYGLRNTEGRVMEYVALEKHMTEHAGRYSGEEWEEYRRYAAEAAGFVQQQLADNQYFNTFSSVEAKRKYDLWLPETYAYLRARRPAGHVLPQTDFAAYTPAEIAALGVDPARYERFAFADVDNMFVSMRDGDTRIFGSLFERQRGVAGNGRLHVLHRDHHQIVQLATDTRFTFRDYNLRMDNIDVDFMEDQQKADGGLPQALAGEVLPAAHQPGVGTVRRENYEFDTPYSGYADFLTARYGGYVFAFNTTRDAYGNKRSFILDVPGDAVDLVSGRRVAAGAVSVPPETAMVLKLGGAVAERPRPHHVDFVQALRDRHGVTLTWKPAAGAESYTIRRDGHVIATDVRGTTFKTGKQGSYTVTGVNRHGSGWESQAVEPPAKPLDRVGEVTGRVTTTGRRVEISGGNGKGLGEGDDYYLDKRDIQDTLLFSGEVLTGSGSISARIDRAQGPASGVMLRADARYIYFGADATGRLVLQNRTRDSRHDWQDDRRSPIDAGLQGYTAVGHPYVRLTRDADTHVVRAWASKDGRAWSYVAELFTPFPEGVHAGVAAATAATFTDVEVERHREGTLYARVERVKDQVTLRWSKPDTATRFTVYRKDGAGWRPVLSDALTFAFTDEPLRHGTRFYRIAVIGADGTERPASGLLMATAEPLATVIAEAEKLPAADYTKGSYHLLTRAIAEAKSGGEEETLINRLYAAVEGLVPVSALLRKIALEPSMVEASTVPWGGGGTKAENGWRAFDGDTATFTDTTTAAGWIDVRPAQPVALDGLRYHPRSTHVTRLNGAVLQGSADGGATWTALHTISGVDVARWYDVTLPRTAAYPWLRLAFPSGNANVAELDLLAMGLDRTLLDLLIEEAEAIDPGQRTEALNAALQHATSGFTTQEEIDAAADRLLAAMPPQP
ncbi:Tat pathway signal protein [Nonomuraea sp. SYSU D8015]|uniref:Tat pathway signal protein n=1 Tax=Nonomuraea sp. SYSU D8015 TaxID=2593644 RepID=UPI0016610BFC|nr:Tat pathway signal protein [Nonomuraea sp. SYSU D8015]